MKTKQLIEYFKGKKIPYSIIAKNLGVSTKTIYNWFEKERLKHTSYLRLLDYYRSLNEKEERNLTMNQQNMLIEYQQKEIEKLKSKINKVESLTPYYNDGISSDIVFDFKIKFNWSLKQPGIKVMYKDSGNYVPIMAKKLGYTEEEMIELLEIDQLVDYKNHKIHKLRTEEQKEEMMGVLNNFLRVYSKIKMNTTMMVAEIPVMYTHKNGSVHKSNVEYRVNWVKGSGSAHIRWLKD